MYSQILAAQGRLPAPSASVRHPVYQKTRIAGQRRPIRSGSLEHHQADGRGEVSTSNLNVILDNL